MDKPDAEVFRHMHCVEHEETEEERECALYAMKWMNLCREFRLDPAATTRELKYYIQKGAQT